MNPSASRRAGQALRRTVALTSAALLQFCAAPSSSRATTVLSPGTTYTVPAGTVYSSSVSFEGGTLKLQGIGGNQDSQFFIDSDPLAGTGTIQLSGADANAAQVAPVSSLPGVTISPGITITSVSSYGGIVGTPTQSLTLLGPVLCPTGTLTITGSNWTAASLSASGAGNLVLDGTFSTPSTLANFQPSTGGALTLQGSLSNAGSTLDLSSLAPLTLTGTINGGTLAASAGHATFLTHQYAKLNAVTVDGDLSSSYYLNFTGGLTLANNHTLSFTDPYVAGTGPLTGSGTIVLNNDGFASSGYIGADSIGPGITIRSGTNPSGNVVTDGVSASLFQGTVSAQGGSLAVGGNNWVNTGTFSVSNGSLSLGGSFSPSSVGTLLRSGNSRVLVNGTLNMPAGDDTLLLNSSTGNWYFSAATINGGILRTADGAKALIAGPVIAHGLTLAGEADITVSGTLNAVSTGLLLDNATIVVGAPGGLIVASAPTLQGDVFGNANILLGGGGLVTPGSTSFTYGPAITFTSTSLGSLGASGQSITVQGNILSQTPQSAILLASSSFTNAGHITAANGGIVGLNPLTFVNNGTIDLSAGGLELIGNCTTASYRALALPSSALYIGGTLDNTGDSLTSTAATPITIANDSTVKGGTLTGSPDAPLTVGTCTLTGTTLAGTITYTFQPYGQSTYTFADGSALTLLSPAGDQAVLPLSSNVTLAGSLDVAFSGQSPWGEVMVAGNTPLNLPAGLTIHTGTQGGTVYLSQGGFTQHGTISAQTPGTSITLQGSITNAGTLRAINSSALIATGGVANSGLITTGASSTVKIRGPFTNSGRVDFAGGSLILDYLGTSTIDFARSQLLTGRHGGDWAAPSGFVSSSAAADSRLAVGYAESSLLLHLSGTHTATWAGQPVDSTAVLLQTTFYGDANLDGLVNADDYALLDAGYARYLAGTIPAGHAHWTDGDFNYDGAIDSQDYLLLDTTAGRLTGQLPESLLAERELQFGPAYVSALTAAVPEPAALGFLGLCFPALLPRRRR